MAKVIKNAISSEYLRYKIDEDISIYEGRFCIYLDRKYRCSGIIYYKMTPPISINFKAQILFVEDEDVDLELDYDNAILEMYGYKPISITINARNDFNMEGYINDNHIKSKNSFVDYVDFNIVNLDKFPGDLIKHVDKLFAGRIEFDIGDFHITIDKRYDYRFFKLMRIKDLTILNEDTIHIAPPKILTTENTFKQKCIHIKLHIQKEMAYRVYDEFDNFTKMEDGSFISEIDMPDSEWTLYYISTFGPYCEILEPNELKEKFKDHLEKTLSIYK